jgi:glycosyltransferase involved in cell wall biosynthesis
MSNVGVTLVVTTKNSEATLRPCLESIRNQTMACTLVVVDNDSSDATPEIAAQFADIVLNLGPERSAQRNAGAATSNNHVVGFIDSDMVLDPTVVAEAVSAVDHGAMSVVVPETTVGEGYWARVSAFERSFYLNSPSIEAPRFFSRSAFELIGGFDEAMTGAEDWDLGLRTVELGPRVRTVATITHDEGRVRYFNSCAKKAYYAPGLMVFAKKHGRQAFKDVATRQWLRDPRKLLHPLGPGLLLLKLGQGVAMTGAIVGSTVGLRSALPRRPTAKTGRSRFRQ